MARKNVFTFPIIPTTSPQSLASSFVTAATIVRYMDNSSYQIVVTTSNSTGTFTVEASLDYSVNESTNSITNPGTWATLPLSGTPVVNAANDVILLDLNQLPFEAIRLRYTAGTAGTGTCTATLMTRQLGG